MFQLQLIIQAVLAGLCQRLKVGNNCNQIWEQISDIWLWPAQQLSLKKASCKLKLPQSFASWRVGGIEAWCLILSRTVFGYPEILLNVDHAPVWPCRNWKPKACFTMTTQLQLLFVCSHLFIARISGKLEEKCLSWCPSKLPNYFLKMCFATCLRDYPLRIGCTTFISLLRPTLKIASHWGLIVECTHGPSIWKCAFVIIPDLYVLRLDAFIANKLNRDMPVCIFLRRKMFWNSTATWYQSCPKDSRGKDSWNFSPEMILHLISRGQHCLSQLDATYTCPNFGGYCSVIDRLRGTLLEIVEKVSCIWCSFCIVATPTLPGVPSLVVSPSEFPVEWLGILGTKPLLPSSDGIRWNLSTHCSAFRTDTERLFYFVIDWLEPLSIFGSSVFNCLQEKAPVWWYVFSIAFRSSGSWQVDSTSWVCWSRTVKQIAVFSWALEADAVFSRRRVEVWSTWLGPLSHTILRLILHDRLSRPLASCISYSTIKHLLDLLFCRMGGQIFRLVNKPSWVTWLLYDPN